MHNSQVFTSIVINLRPHPDQIRHWLTSGSLELFIYLFYIAETFEV